MNLRNINLCNNSEWPSLGVIAGVILSLLIGISGCAQKPGLGYELAEVTGVVTLDGKPLEGAEVVFEPQNTGSITFGTTDAEGKYELRYDAQTPGAPLGPHVVRIRKIGGPDTNYDTLNMLPPQYDENSTLRATVEPVTNVFNFELVSKQ